MSYDQVASFIGALAAEIERQANADLAKGRPRLASELYATAKTLYNARAMMDLAWEICKPYMKG